MPSVVKLRLRYLLNKSDSSELLMFRFPLYDNWSYPLLLIDLILRPRSVELLVLLLVLFLEFEVPFYLTYSYI